jgi:FHA domain
MESRERRDKKRGRRRSATVLESVDELIGRPGRETTDLESPPIPAPPRRSSGPDGVAAAFRPSLRPPMAILCAYDDGQESGETARIRSPSFVVGRNVGDLVIPHDGGMSGRHAEIARRLVDGRYRWSLRDLGSTNGTFVRTALASLVNGQELLIGGVRFRFEIPDGPPAPRLVEIDPQGGGPSFSITEPDTGIGSDPRRCTIVLGRPWVSPLHAVIRARRRGRWIIEKVDAGDGLWLRIQEVDLGRGGQFQCGEQRFLIRIL